MTAAHCVVNARGEVDNTRLTILGGTVNIDPATTMSVEGERQRVLAAYVPQVDEETGGTFQTLTYANDIALLRLSSPIMETASIANNRRSIALPAVNQTNTLYFPYAAVFTAGWGKKASGQLSSPVLQEVVLPYVDPSVCHAFFDPQNLAFPPGALCAGFSTGSYAHCQGDSGGPLYYRPETAPNAAFPATEVLLGIVSWGRGCEQPGSYGKYSSTLYFSSWIIARILEYCTDPAAALRPPDEDDCLNELAPGAL
ncbi:MAG: serine protease [Bauldia sp.]